MTTVYLIRHGETEANQHKIIQGWLDTALSEQGRLQAETLAHRFEALVIDAVYSSDLSRAIDTAKAICKMKCRPLQTDARLREINMGAWSGRSWSELSEQDGKRIALFLELSPAWRAPDGESFEELRTRVGNALKEIAGRHDGQTIAVVCHGAAIRHTLAMFKGLSVFETKQEPLGVNTAISHLEFDGTSVRILLQNDASHLETGNNAATVCP